MDSFKSGFIAISGRPNMGKSTFLNRILGQKVAIVSPKPQTTRTRILGVLHRTDGQMIFLDTPGIHDHGGNLLNRSMVQTAYGACREAEVILFFVDALRGLTNEEIKILKRLQNSSPLMLVFNKMDRIEPPKLLPLMAAAQELAAKHEIKIAEMIPISALKGHNLDRLLDTVMGYLQPGPRYFPTDQVTDQPERFIAAEIIRERLFCQLDQELPYSLAVQIEQFQEEKKLVRIQAVILVERESHKGIVIGQGGAKLKLVGSEARKQLESLLGVRVFLQLWVKVRQGWTDNHSMLQDLGYPLAESEAQEDGGNP